MTDSPFATRASSGDYFKPADHQGDLAIIFEFKRVLKDQPHNYQGQQGVRDVAYADVSCFRNSEDVESKTPSLVMKNVAITNEVLVKDIERNDWLGKATVQVIRKAGRAYVYRDGAEIPADAMDAATAYYLAREQEVQKNLEAVPSFDD